jgi:hypothetical protein
MLDRTPSPGAARARRARWRRRHGLVPRTLDVDENALAAALIASGRLSADEALCPDLIERELSALVADFISRWRNSVTGYQP